jgi:curli biogenesis system outer membrane secretion channel CsgG
MQILSKAGAALALLIAMTLSGCLIVPAPAEATARGGYPRAERYIAAVLDVENRVQSEDVEGITQNATNLLIDELLGYDRLRIVEREKLDLILKELQLGTSGLVDTNQAKQVGNLLGVDALLFVVLEAAGSEEKVRSALIAKTVKRETGVTMTARLVHAETGEILASAEATNTVSQRSSSAFGFAKAGNMTTETAALQEAVDSSTRALAAELAKRIPRRGE